MRMEDHYILILTQIKTIISIITNMKESQANNETKQTKGRTRKMAQAGLFGTLLSIGTHMKLLRGGGNFCMHTSYFVYFSHRT